MGGWLRSELILETLTFLCRQFYLRADFEDPKADADYHRGYKLLSEFFAEHL